MINIPGYQILCEIGRGGMGIVYRGVQTKSGTHVALKIIPPGYASDEQFTSRFLREAKTLTLLDHRNIVKILDHGSIEGSQYIAMEYIEGQSLKELIRKGPMPLREAARILSQVADALEYAHGKGIIHRDVKPENILIDVDGVTHLVDFGIAKGFDAKTRMTAVGMTLGTAQYMSPEQCRGEKLRPASDFYSLGIILYEMLTGKPPFDSTDAFAVALMHINDPLPSLDNELSALEPFFRKILDKNPLNRYDTASALSNDMELILQGKSIPLQKTTVMPTEKTQVMHSVPERTSNRKAFIGAGIGALIVLIVLATFIITRTKTHDIAVGGGGGGGGIQANSTTRNIPESTAHDEGGYSHPFNQPSKTAAETKPHAVSPKENDSSKKQGARPQSDKINQKVAMAESLLQQKKFDEAQEVAEGILKDNPENIHAYRVKDKAQKELLKIKDEENRNKLQREALSYYKEGKAHFEHGEYKICITKMNEALKRSPNFEDAKKYITLAEREIAKIYQDISDSVKTKEITIKKK